MIRFKITTFRNPGGSDSFRVTGRALDGTQIRRNFRTHFESLLYAAGLELSVLKSSAEASASLSHVTLPDGLALPPVVQPSQTTAALTGQGVTLSDAIQAFLNSPAVQQLRSKTQSDYRCRLTKLNASNPGTQISAINSERLEKFCWDSDPAAGTVNGRRRVAFTFFHWCVNKGMLAVNPVERIAKALPEPVDPQVLTVDQVKRLLSAAVSCAQGKLVPYVALGLFAGLRAAEIRRLDWSAILLDRKVIRISGDVAKCRSRRIVDLSDNAVIWLRRCEGASLVPPNFQKLFDSVRKVAGIQVWEANALRHTALSFHYARGGNDVGTAAWAGNSPAMLHKHYRALVTAAEAEQYWKLAPESVTQSE